MKFQQTALQYEFWFTPPNIRKPSSAFVVSPFAGVMKWDQREQGNWPNIAKASHVDLLMLNMQMSFNATFYVYAKMESFLPP